MKEASVGSGGLFYANFLFVRLLARWFSLEEKLKSLYLVLKKGSQSFGRFGRIDEEGEEKITIPFIQDKYLRFSKVSLSFLESSLQKIG